MPLAVSQAGSASDSESPWRRPLRLSVPVPLAHRRTATRAVALPVSASAASHGVCLFARALPDSASGSLSLRLSGVSGLTVTATGSASDAFKTL